MSPEPAPAAPAVFGRTPASAARAAAVLALLGSAAVLALTRILLRPGSPAQQALEGLGVPAGADTAAAAAGVAGVVLLSLLGFFRAVRDAERFRITDAGLEVSGALGRYTLEWENIEAAEAAPGDALGIRVKDREAVLRTHSGTARQREWLRTQEPFGDWDFLYHRADLGSPAKTVLGWLEPRLTASRRPG